MIIMMMDNRNVLQVIIIKIIIIESEILKMKERLMKMKEKLVTVKNFIAEKKYGIIVFLNTLLTPTMVYASPAEAKWNTLTTTYITPWVQKLGGAVCFVGALEFALGWQRDDPEAKTKGLRTFIAGAIVTAVGFGASTFMN